MLQDSSDWQVFPRLQPKVLPGGRADLASHAGKSLPLDVSKVPAGVEELGVSYRPLEEASLLQASGLRQVCRQEENGKLKRQRVLLQAPFVRRLWPVVEKQHSGAEALAAEPFHRRPGRLYFLSTF